MDPLDPDPAQDPSGRGRGRGRGRFAESPMLSIELGWERSLVVICLDVSTRFLAFGFAGGVVAAVKNWM